VGVKIPDIRWPGTTTRVERYNVTAQDSAAMKKLAGVGTTKPSVDRAEINRKLISPDCRYLVEKKAEEAERKRGM